MRPLEPLRQSRRAVETTVASAPTQSIAEEVDQLELPPIATLPKDHPLWRHDGKVFTPRAQLLLAKLAPIVMQVVGFWDHAVRMIRIGDQRLCIDASGSYRLE